MLKSLHSRELHIAAILAGGMVALFGILYGPISSFAIGGADWALAFLEVDRVMPRPGIALIF